MKRSEKIIRSYLARSSGNAGHPTDHVIRTFLGMVDSGEADMETFQRLAGDDIVRRMNQMAVEELEISEK